MADMINHPPHYTYMNPAYEPINVIEAWDLGFHLGNTVKYIARAKAKRTPIEDLKKARWYLDREIKRLEGTVRRLSNARRGKTSKGRVVQKTLNGVVMARRSARGRKKVAKK